MKRILRIAVALVASAASGLYVSHAAAQGEVDDPMSVLRALTNG